MRITAQAKLETEQAIRAAAARLFARNGLDATSTRDITVAVGIASGTLFNYFPSKEALALALVRDALDQGRAAGHARLAERIGSLDEDLFTLIAYAIRSLEPVRPYLGEVLEAGLSPLAVGSLSPEAERIRAGHLEDVAAVLARHGVEPASAGPASMHLYWALFIAVLAYWSADTSPMQEDTRALIDHTVRMFASSLRPASSTVSSSPTAITLAIPPTAASGSAPNTVPGPTGASVPTVPETMP